MVVGMAPISDGGCNPDFVGSHDLPCRPEPARLVGADRTHVMLQLRQGETVRKAMAFGMGARADELVMGQPLHVVYTPRWNTFRGTTNLEFTLADFRVGQRPEF